LWITFFDQPNLPGTTPLFDLALSPNSGLSLLVWFKVHQLINIIFRRESVCYFILVLPCPSRQVECYTDIQRAISFARSNIDKELLCQLRKDWIPASAGMTDGTEGPALNYC
jgi:hypothetical protein